MASSGSGYDYSPHIISPDGKVFQIEYAQKAVESRGTVIGVRCTDGVVLASEKLLTSKLLVKKSNRTIFPVERGIGACAGGWEPDAQEIVKIAKNIGVRWRQSYGEGIAPGRLADQMAEVLYTYTTRGNYRPLGTALLLAGYNAVDREHELYMCDTDGEVFRYFGTAVGKGARAAKTEIQKRKLSELKCAEALPIIAEIMYTIWDAAKDKPFELEMGWVCEASEWQFTRVPEDVRAAADAAGKAAAEEDDDDDDDDDDDE